MSILNSQYQQGITLVELSIALLVAVLVIGTATPAYIYLINKARTNKTIDEIRSMQREIVRYERKNNRYPDTLLDIYPQQPMDPWGNLYQYLNIRNAPNPNLINPRTDNNFKKLNIDFDLYSTGADALSLGPIPASESQDDILRGDNGDYVGLAREY
ncbi:MAG: prepilin-type cleavage/methylation domain-containing protein [Gammaproteobacteria bacterium]|nr:prepilin-type cleavage/methylation domain-containing protein [Gammaproteobacteria bacterium]